MREDIRKEKYMRDMRRKYMRERINQIGEDR